MKPNIVFCCPTRSKPHYVDKFLAESIDKSRLPDTVFALGIDEDQRELYDKECKLLQEKHLQKEGKLQVHYFPRPDSLGEKFNLIAGKYPDAEAYVMGVDDLAIKTIAWDIHVNDLGAFFDDGIGVVTFGKQWNEPGLPAFQMCTRQWCELQGFFMAPFFPFWWHDTWNKEMYSFLGRGLHLDIEVQYPAPHEEPPTPRRDIQFWALFFDFMRPWRIQRAQQMMEKMDCPKWWQYQVRGTWDQLAEHFERSNARCRDPLWVMRFSEGRMSEAEDERHRRLKAKAEQLMQAYSGQEAQAA